MPNDAPDDHPHDHDHDHGDGECSDPSHDHSGHDHAGHDHGVSDQVDLKRYEGVDGHVIRQTSGCGRELLAVVQRERLDAAINAAAVALARKVTIKGFRPGKAPPARVKAMHRAAIEREAMEKLVTDVWQEAAKAANVTPVANPRLTELDATEGQPIRFAATFEVLPEIEIQGLDAIKATDRTVRVTDGDVDQELEGLRAMRAKLEPSARVDAAPGLLAVVNIARFGKDAAADAQPVDSRDGLVVEVGAEGNPAELDRALLGMEVGEKRTFTMAFPEEHPDESLRGQSLRHRVELVGLRERVNPPLDDAFAKELGGFESLAALKADVRIRIVEARRRQAIQERDHEILEQLFAKNPLEMPPSLVEKEADGRLRRGIERLAKQGVDLDSAKIDWPTELQRARQGAERDLKADYLLELAARAKSVEVTEADVSAEIMEIAKRAGKPPAAVKAELEKTRQMSDLRGSLRRRRVLDSLGSGATIQVE